MMKKHQGSDHSDYTAALGRLFERRVAWKQEDQQNELLRQLEGV